MKANLYEVALHLAEGIGGVTARHLLAAFGSAEEIFKAKKSQILRLQGVGEKVAKSLTEQIPTLFQRAEKEILQAEKKNIQMHFFTEPTYPSRLKQIDDAPILIYQKGDASLNQEKHLAIVGTRQASHYGRQFLEELLLELKAYKPLIISGMAYGIDIIAHREALKNQLCTVGVLANGLDLMYPALHQHTAEQMLAEGGALISESPLGTKPDAPRFPARNRITAALADIVLVVESMKKGGAMITAQYANDYHREVAALPGNYHLATSEGCNLLIKKHQAHLVTCAEDLAYLMNWEKESQTAKKKKKSLNLSEYSLNQEETLVIKELFEKEQSSIDELSLFLSIPLNHIAVILLNLEMQDLIEALPGKRFRLKQKLYF
ncbi:MAG: DNA-processing protein DprA [Raineya sp.]